MDTSRAISEVDSETGTITVAGARGQHASAVFQDVRHAIVAYCFALVVREANDTLENSI